MTIAAGFRFRDGILLCADTEETLGIMKLRTSKIFPLHCAASGGAVVAFAISGDVPYARMAVEQCQQAIMAMNPPSMSSRGIRDVIGKTLRDVYKRHIYPHPDHGKANGPDFQFLIAMWSPIDGAELFQTYETAIHTSGAYSCMGVGYYIAEYVAAPLLYRVDLPLPDVVALATHMLIETKQFVRGCGGSSDFFVLRDSGEFTNVTNFDISQKEEFSTVFGQLVRSLFFDAANLSLEDKKVRERADYLGARLEALRRDQRGAVSNREALIKFLSENGRPAAT